MVFIEATAVVTATATATATAVAAVAYFTDHIGTHHADDSWTGAFAFTAFIVCCGAATYACTVGVEDTNVVAVIASSRIATGSVVYGCSAVIVTS
jgi:hypothetical protein